MHLTINITFGIY